MYIPDSKQSLGQCWVMVVVVGNTSLFACWHLPNISPILACWPKGVGPRSSGQQIPTMVQRIIAIWDIPVRVIWEGLQWSILNVFFLQLMYFYCWFLLIPVEVLFLKQKHWQVLVSVICATTSLPMQKPCIRTRPAVIGVLNDMNLFCNFQRHTCI